MRTFLPLFILAATCLGVHAQNSPQRLRLCQQLERICAPRLDECGFVYWQSINRAFASVAIFEKNVLRSEFHSGTYDARGYWRLNPLYIIGDTTAEKLVGEVDPPPRDIRCKSMTQRPTTALGNSLDVIDSIMDYERTLFIGTNRMTWSFLYQVTDGDLFLYRSDLSKPVAVELVGRFQTVMETLREQPEAIFSWTSDSRVWLGARGVIVYSEPVFGFWPTGAWRDAVGAMSLKFTQSQLDDWINLAYKLDSGRNKPTREELIRAVVDPERTLELRLNQDPIIYVLADR